MRATVIHNPVAGQRDSHDELLQVIQYLEEQGFQLDRVEKTHGASDVTTYARRAALSGSDVVFLSGGDGSIAEAVDGLVNTDAALAVLPSGTGNVFARQLNLPVPGGIHPRPLLESARLLLAGQVRRVDVGRVTPRGAAGPAHHFLLWSGIGFDAAVNIGLHADMERKRRLGLIATVITGFLTLRDFAGTSVRIRVDNHRMSRRIMMMVASNIQIYGVIFRLTQHAVMDDGLLDIVCFQGTTPARTLLHALKLLVNRHVDDPKVDIFRARRIEIVTARPMPVHVDGDTIGYTPVVIEAVPKSLNLLTPDCAPATLFMDGAGALPPENAWEWMQRMAADVQVALKERTTSP
ncbi:MAG: Diacylglycerol kinase [Chloroflexi bacterium ADurb.Bin325]|nr:MAG: Diacylglycerol kinase [Chloroflexi bacterium ADurb.Bin325]